MEKDKSIGRAAMVVWEVDELEQTGHDAKDRLGPTELPMVESRVQRRRLVEYS